MPTANGMSMFKMWRRLSATGKTASIAGTTVVICAALFFAPEKITPLSSALFARDPYAKESHVDVGARLDRNILSKGDQAILEVNIQNNNTDPLTEFHASITAPGFEWSQRNAEKQLSGSVPAGSSLSAAIPLRAMARSGTYTVSVFYSWTKKSRYSSSVSLGPLKMEGLFSQDHWSRFLGRGNQLIKDLTLPIVLAVLAYYFQLQQKARDERQQVRQNILSLVMTLAERHYMPIVTSALNVIQHYQKLKDKDPVTSPEEVFFDVMFLLKRMDYLRRDKGQIFFQDNAAESIARQAWFVVRNKLRSVLADDKSKFPEEQVELALQKIGNDDRFSDSKRYWLHLQTSFTGFQKWLAADPTEFEQYLDVVDVIQAVFRYEANRPFFDHWYGGQKKLDLKRETTRKSDFFRNFPKTSATQEAVKALDEAWPLYLKTVDLA
jgi:hypothetical protein